MPNPGQTRNNNGVTEVYGFDGQWHSTHAALPTAATTPPPPPPKPVQPKPGDHRYVAVNLPNGQFVGYQDQVYGPQVVGRDEDGQPVYGMGWGDSGQSLLGAPHAGSGGSTAYSSSQQSQQEAEAFQAGESQKQRDFQKQQDEANRAFQAEQERIRREEEARQGRLKVLSDLVSNFASNQQKSRELLFSLGPDPFKFAAGFQGIAQRGTTPQQAYANQLTNYSNQAVPTVNPDASRADIENAINTVTGGNGAVIPGLPTAPGSFGFAEGGQLPAVPGTGPFRVLVGEKGPEVLEVADGKVKVLPIQRTAEGGTEFDVPTVAAGIAPLYRALGLSGNIPTTSKEQYGWDVPRGGDLLNKLGTLPSLVRNADTGAAYFRDRNGGLHAFSSQDQLNQAGFSWDKFTNVGDSDFAKLGTIQGPYNVGFLNDIPNTQTPDFGPYGDLLHTKVGNFLLPAPHRVANALLHLKETNKFLYDVALSGYESAGYPKEAVESQIEAAQIHGFTPQISRRLVGFR